MDADAGDQLSAALLVPAAHGRVDLDSSGAGFTFSSWDSSFGGTDAFTYAAADSQGLQSKVATVSFSVNLPPVAVDDSTPTLTVASTATSASFASFSVLSNDRDPDSGAVRRGRGGYP
eukprot:TRINITY_DN505_c0_g2_i2.p4 TRINITY_DN505_c0_g2~~TRINITY_DN505_c0_g2_i2.p4  ORF type:complete len:118 (-),score=30.17 TRINITY_DN505_c0_g2_i2:195-548(-)